MATAIPPLVEQGSRLVANVPALLKQATNSSTWLGQLNERFGVQERLQQLMQTSASGMVTGILGAGEIVFGALASVLLVLALTAYFLADLPRVRATLYRFVPHDRRPRAILIGDEIMAKVGGYVLGNLIISVISAVTTFIWLVIFGVPYPLLLAVLVALLDLIPVVGSMVAGLLVALVAFTVSVPVGVATLGFYLAYKMIEDWLLSPRIFGAVLKVPALVTAVAIVIGGSLLGVVGALVALPTAAALMLLTREVLLPRLDRGSAGGTPSTAPPG